MSGRYTKMQNIQNPIEIENDSGSKFKEVAEIDKKKKKM